MSDVGQTRRAFERRVEADIGRRVDRAVFDQSTTPLSLSAFLRSKESRIAAHYLRARVRVLAFMCGLSLLHSSLSAVVLICAMAFIRLLIDGQLSDGGSLPLLGFDLKIPFLDSLSGPRGVAILLIAVITAMAFRSAIHFWLRHLAVRIQNQFTQDVRADTTNKLLSLDIEFYTDNRLGDVVYLQNGIVGRCSQLVPFLQELVLRTLNGLVLFLILFKLSLPMTAVLIVFGSVYFLLLGGLRKKMQELTMESSDLSREAGSIFLELVHAIRVIRQGGQEERARNKYLDAAIEREASVLRLNDHGNLIKIATEIGGAVILLALVMGGIWALGKDLMQQAGFTIGYFVVAWTTLGTLQQAMDLRVRLVQMVPYLGMISDFLSDTRYTKRVQTSTTLPKVGKIEEGLAVRGLQFSYDEGKSVLDSVDLDFPKGSITALVGLSGSGKSTLLEILAGFQGPSQGKILIDGEDVSQFDMTSYRKMIGYVTQDMILFNDTIMENLLYLKPEATDEELERALALAQAKDFIASCEHAYDTVIGERGLKVSGGQRQRLTLARVLVPDPPVLLLDEATSALDLRTESQILKSLRDMKQDKVIVVAAHRLSAITEADNIVVLSHGQIIEQGTHEDLISKDGFYHGLYRIQELSGPEALSNIGTVQE